MSQILNSKPKLINSSVSEPFSPTKSYRKLVATENGTGKSIVVEISKKTPKKSTTSSDVVLDPRDYQLLNNVTKSAAVLPKNTLEILV